MAGTTESSGPGCETGDFEIALAALDDGYVEGTFAGASWGATVQRSADGSRTWLFAEDLAGSDIVSFNLYRLKRGRATLRPCEMTPEKVIDFVLNFKPFSGSQAG